MRFLLLLVAVLTGQSLAIELTQRQIVPPALFGPSANKATEICWGYNESHVEVQLAYPTQGWVAMGLSPDGGMDQSDVLFGYIDDATKEVVVQDRWLEANTATRYINLSMDAQQDWQTVSGSQNESHTVIRAVRAIKTCDTVDRPFKDAAVPVLYSYNFKDPESKTAPIHMHNFRGSVNLNFLQEAMMNKSVTDKEVTKVLTFTVKNVTVTSAMPSVYWCSLMQIPKLDKKYQSIASHPVINPKNMPFIHHMLVYTCDKIPPEFLASPTFQCGPADSDPVHASFLMRYCPSLIGGWAMGAEDVKYEPADVGQPFTPEMSGMYVAIQMHYNNPERHQFDDDSGIQYMLTDKIRKYDSGSIMAGILTLDWGLTLPPGQDIFRVRGTCSDQCTQGLPKEGITAYSSALHMHTRGLAGVIRHFRGSQELPNLGANPKWDFNYQSSHPINPFQTILPGDRIVVECNFTTANDIQPIFGGEGSLEEMCLGFISYYPFVKTLKTCGTRFLISKYLGLLAQNRPGMSAFLPRLDSETAQALLTGQVDGMNRKNYIKKLQEPLRSYLSNQQFDAQKAKIFEDFYMDQTGSNYWGACIGQGNASLVMNDRPPNISPYMGSIADSSC